MKKLLNIGLVLMAVTSSLAATANDKHRACETTGKLAESMMTARQAGVPLEKAMKKVMNIYPKGDLLLLDAYKHPRFTSEKYQKRAIQDFKEATLLECYKLVSEP